MWQTLETKAKFISQIMNGSTTVRSADDISEAALSYAEVKALASGNPLVMEKIETDTEIQRLEVLRSSYKRNRFRMQDQLSYIPNKISVLKTEISNGYSDLTVRQNTVGENFIININGQDYTDRKEAGKIIVQMQEMIKAAPPKYGEEVRHEIGSFAGFKLSLTYKNNFFTDDEVQLVLTGNAEYETYTSAIPANNMTRLEDLVQGIEAQIQEKEDSLKEVNRQKESLEKELTKPFEHQAKLETLLVRQRELNRLLDKDKAQELVDEEEAVV
jgi:predicted ATPase